jgi:5'-nucleotidase
MTSDKANILLCNDDGINAPGLYALWQEVQQVGDVVIVAPDGEQSAVGHAITLSDPLRVWEFEKTGGFFGYAVNGTPADCIKIAYWALLDKKPDLIISGINLGSNTGINVIYSGTVSAATEGTILGIPSFAVSLSTYSKPDFKYAARFAAKLARDVLAHGLPRGTYLNVNVPNLPEEEIQGVVVTRQGLSNYKEHFDRRVDPQNRVYYWLTGKKVEVESEGDVDDRAIIQRKVSITPLHYDLTNYSYLEELKSWNLER